MTQRDQGEIQQLNYQCEEYRKGRGSVNRERRIGPAGMVEIQGRRRRFRILLTAVFAVGCGGEMLGQEGWRCDVTLDMDGRMATASGAGATQSEARNAARRSACSQLELRWISPAFTDGGPVKPAGVSLQVGSANRGVWPDDRMPWTRHHLIER